MNVMVCGHPRSGNNYLRALINRNFIGKENYLDVKFYHGLIRNLNDDMKYIYIEREFEDVMKSLLAIRNSNFSDDMSMETFLSLKYSESIKIKPGKVKYHWDDGNVTVEESRFGWSWLRKINMTPEQWYNKYCNHLHKSIKENTDKMLFVSFHDLMNDFVPTMDKISTFLMNKKFNYYQNIDKKVGPLPIEYDMDATKLRGK